MHKEILSDEQIKLLPLIKEFHRDYYLVGGTAIALHIGHRRSIDFDLFTLKNIQKRTIIKKINELGFKIERLLYEDSEQLHIVVNGVKITFFSFPFVVKPEFKFEEKIKLPSLLSLAAMKFYALGRRYKWKDYVDLYFIMKNHFSFHLISAHTKSIFAELYNEKLLREQLAFFEDIDYTEQVEYLKEQVDNQSIKQFLIDISLS